MSDSIVSKGEIVRAFLRRPSDHNCFNAFFDECLRQTVFCLNSLRARGYRLPVVGECNAASLRDLAYGVLGSLLRTERGKQPFHIVMDYFASKGIDDTNSVAAEMLHESLMALLWNFTRQELFRIAGQEDPQKAKLKRRLGDVLAGSDYEVDCTQDGPVVYVNLKSNRDNLRLDRGMITLEALHQLVEDAYLETCNLSQWCAKIFAELDGMTEVQNRLRKHDLISVAVGIVLRYLETDGFHAPRVSTPEGDFDAETMHQARSKTIIFSRDSVIRDFVQKGKISPEVGDRFAQAIDQHLTDLCMHGNTDPIPQYFREVMPESEHEKYLVNYKYVFETVINRAVEDFRNRLKN